MSASILLGGIAVFLGVLVLILIVTRVVDVKRMTRLVAENATLRADTDNATRQFARLQEQLAPARQIENDRSRLTGELEAERQARRKSDIEVDRWQERCDELQKQVQVSAESNSELRTRLGNSEKRVTEYGEIEKRCKDAFRALSADIMEDQRKSLTSTADGQLKSRQEAVEKLVNPLAEKIDLLSRERLRLSAELKEQINHVLVTSSGLMKETQSLSNALKKPGVRGRWGEIQLKRILELSGLKENIDYTEQDTARDQGERRRTDIIVHMPDDRKIVLDSKVPLSALMDAFDAVDEAGKLAALERHAAQVKNHVKELASKEYQKLFAGTPDWVIMVMQEFAFLPAIEKDTDLAEWALDKKVIIVTPPTLLALLRAVAMTWKQKRALERAEEIVALARDLYERYVVFLQHYNKIGRSLSGTVEDYNRGVGSLDKRVRPSLRKFQELDVPTTKELPALASVDDLPKTVHDSAE